MDLVCYRCHRKPEEIYEYVEAVTYEPAYFDSAEDYVTKEEGTYNPADKTFCCTECYIEIGQPSSSLGWQAPPRLPPESRVAKKPEL